MSVHLINLLQYLLPGLVAAAMFYGLTPHSKPAPFERIISALVFTFFVTATGEAASWIPLLSDSAKTSVALLIIAVVIGGAAAVCANYDIPHCWLRNLRLTDQMGGPSEWSAAFSDRKGTYIILNLKDGRRIVGWPEVWPDSPRGGHFLLTDYEWIENGGESSKKRTGDSSILINAESVDMVEFIVSNKGEQNEPERN